MRIDVYIRLRTAYDWSQTLCKLPYREWQAGNKIMLGSLRDT
jgi:hypothetical protein